MNPRIGILGDGQLARMLAQAAPKLGLSVLVLSTGPQSPAAKVGAPWVHGTLKASDSLRDFFNQIDIAIFENEFVDCEAIRVAAKGLHTRFAPELSVIEELQQKLGQKSVLNRLSIPTSEHWEFTPLTHEDDWLAEVEYAFSTPFVLKWSLFGYDGKGVLIVRDLKKEIQRVRDFIAVAHKRGIRVYAERFVPFRRELAIIAVYSKTSGFDAYPLVISEQERGICRRITGPAIQLGVPSRLEDSARKYAQKLARDLSLEGVFAIEFFELDSGELIVNEIAPRVHNAGHFTLDACDTSQFENHLRAVMGLSLGSTAPTATFAMLNLLGPSGVEVRTRATHFLPSTDQGTHSIRCHWYEKEDIQPDRKLGHLNGLASSPAGLPQLTEEMNAWHQEWVENLKNLDQGKTT